MNKLMHPLRLTQEALRDLWRWKRSIAAIVAIVAIPTAVVSYFTGDTDPALSAYSAFATVFMNVALLWALIRLSRKEAVSVRKAYYQGTGMTVRFLLLTGLFFMMMIPFIIGAAIYLNATTGDAPVAGIAENLLVGLVWLLLAWPTFYWLTRSLLGILELDQGLGPIEAARASRTLVLGRARWVFGRIAWLLLILIVTVTLPAWAVFATASQSIAIPAAIVLQLFSSLVVLPFAYLYLYRLHADLKTHLLTEAKA